jgi:hypothetical protein
MYKTTLHLKDNITIENNKRFVTVRGKRKEIPLRDRFFIFYSTDLFSAVQFIEDEVDHFIIERTLA